MQKGLLLQHTTAYYLFVLLEFVTKQLLDTVSILLKTVVQLNL